MSTPDWREEPAHLLVERVRRRAALNEAVGIMRCGATAGGRKPGTDSKPSTAPGDSRWKPAG